MTDKLQKLTEKTLIPVGVSVTAALLVAGVAYRLGLDRQAVASRQDLTEYRQATAEFRLTTVETKLNRLADDMVYLKAAMLRVERSLGTAPPNTEMPK